MSSVIKYGVMVLLLGLFHVCTVQAGSAPWVLVDTSKRTITVYKDDRPVETFGNIALGRKGAGIKRRRGDDTTPTGVFRVGWLNKESVFSLFIGLDYPNLDYAEQAYKENRIDAYTYYSIRYALEAGHTPPQDTLLGGAIGIHGIGKGDPGIHAQFDWTNGCVALNNQQVWRLAEWVDIGTWVEIR